ncbi:ABC transporter substrate-binding protein [Actinoplanes sp. SE50]|uniref:ABC transporter substrate-binding protein n=1 Tax=unclassified Actinoplanes TaxID=2626549 RepID=UPI00023ECBA2|nr:MULTISPECIES: ABC transporter substrate-binding protein [unclassified Actinoplanes]AEV86559.1 putative arabinose-binding protein [Actinoplanes sp. SE50/110]ATO84957.1 ABC transporter substrate-binding protein [Actinoplanes sp. SE50]SLM02366.1 ABC transporter substrate-binding protein [Actinoplanes sp. SE50/110]
MRLSRFLQMAAAASAVAMLATACGSDGGSGGGAGDNVTLNVSLFGNFGYQELYQQYEQAHPNIRIQERTADYNAHHRDLATHLATGSGAADIEAVDTGFIAQMRAVGNQFTDLGTDRAGEYLPWKWQASLTKDGKQIGYGTDVGGLAICYRRDLFQQAGLPADREQVSAAWAGGWDRFIEVGKKFAEKAPEGSAFFDGGGALYNAIIGQAPVGFYDSNDAIVVNSNPEVKKAWDLSVQAIQANLSAKLVESSPEWDNGFAKSRFAAIACPAWMMAKIKDQSKAFAGKWDVASVPGGGGNWGGSYLTVPRQGKHVDEAKKLAAWLTAPEQQSKVFTTKGLLPSIPSLYDRPEIGALQDPFFNNAPIGKIFTTAAKQLQPQHQGPRAGDIQTAIRDGLTRVEQGNQTPDQSWAQTLKDVDRLAK